VEEKKSTGEGWGKGVSIKSTASKRENPKVAGDVAVERVHPSGPGGGGKGGDPGRKREMRRLLPKESAKKRGCVIMGKKQGTPIRPGASASSAMRKKTRTLGSRL